MKNSLSPPALVLPVIALLVAVDGLADDPLQVSGVYPHLRMWNQEGECGTGAVVVWQGDLWAITYAPHMPGGSSDKLYQVTPGLEQRIHEGSVGGTPANRMIHPESNQLLIGPYLIDAEKRIRVIPPSKMFGRLTGNARHLSAPDSKVYYATMEEGLYEVDIRTLDVTCLIRDGNGGAPKVGLSSKLPGYHGKGLYSTQGRLVYANNGDRDPRVKVDPTVPSGALAEWFGEGDWQLVRRNQFTEVTGPGGITGNPNPETDPLWAMGWDARSLLLALLEDGQWHYYRLPKGSHSYDGAHGWNTEWPRIREIGEDDLLATMHGTFWRFPSDFSRENAGGIRPRSNYLKVVGDFCRWGDRIVLGCDDSAKSEFLNTRPFKAEHGAPRQSNSNLWFVAPDDLDRFGPAIGRGSVWLREDLPAGATSDPYLFAGYDHRLLQLTHQSPHPVTFVIEFDQEGTNQWETYDRVEVPAREALPLSFPVEQTGTWIRLKTEQAVSAVTAHFHYRNRDPRTEANGDRFTGIATMKSPASATGVMRSLGYDRLGLVAAPSSDSDDLSYYEINERLELVPANDPSQAQKLVDDVRQPGGSVLVDAASVILVEDGKRYRFPRDDRYLGETPSTPDLDPGQALADFLERSLSKGASVRTSSTHQDYAPSHAVDGRLGDDDLRWISRDDEAGWIELDLGEEKTFRQLWIVSGWKQEAQFVAADFDLQVREENSDDWKPLPGGSVRGNRSVERSLEFEAPVTTRHLRLAAKQPGYLRLYEIALFEDPLEIRSPGRQPGLGSPRICREVATERDLLNLHGTFYELPARNAQGLAKVRPIATHGLAIQDFCSHNGLLFLTGIDAETESDHVFRSEDEKAAVWVGVIDDLWKLGKPRGIGGVWNETEIRAGVPSDPYLMTGYDRKEFTIGVTEPATITLQVDIDGTGLWVPYASFEFGKGESTESAFPEGFSAYWVRAVSDADTTATVLFRYD